VEAASSRELERLLRQFFAVENARDWRTYAGFLHPQVEWSLIDVGRERRVVGREAYLQAIRSAYDGAATKFRCVETMVDHRRGRIAAVLVDELGERSLEVFDVEDGLIRREWEFFLGRP